MEKNNKMRTLIEKINLGEYSNELQYPTQNDTLKIKNETLAKIKTINDSVKYGYMPEIRATLLIKEIESAIEDAQDKFNAKKEAYNDRQVQLEKKFQQDLFDYYSLYNLSDSAKNEIIDFAVNNSDGSHQSINEIVSQLSTLIKTITGN